eukprot:CAMPEP_0172181980 /NCGR_PEP_ID=MMETSP1050-20130122/18135_1 /TAXON_ID=233186 /ORGANISM="Cryptomonas curvata, Strain CCAP979/52" /LENGTH=525 /DNA_ID=CAMNT_0012855355 /DNA_START=122 /DNA_END=1699 /DNA_ORIENTATION=-
MSLRVAKDEFERSLNESRALLEFAQEKKMSPNMLMFVRTAVDKIETTLKEFEKRKQLEAAAEERKKTSAPAPAIFTDKEISVKPLKGEGAKKCNIKKYTASEMPALFSQGKIDLRKPFIVSDGVTDFEALRRKFTAEKLMTNTEAQLRYLSPVKAKEKRTFDKQQSNVPEDEQYEYAFVSIEKFFTVCFNLRAKPDFRKMGGADTEHCEQHVAASLIDANFTDYRLRSLGDNLGWLQELEPGRAEFTERAGELQALVQAKQDLKSSLQRASSRFFAFGPAGSGEQLRQEGMPFVDGLVHGKRRWFMMAPKDFQALRDKAKDVLEPASAFMFFEQQMEELVEEHGLGGKKMKYWQCNQNPGELIYIPGDTIMTSLSLVDSFSYKQHVALSKSVVLDHVNSNIWAPESGVVPTGYQFAACYPDIDVMSAGAALGKQANPLQGQIIAQIMAQYYPSVKARNMLIVNILSECSGVFGAASVEADKTYCPKVWDTCLAQLHKNAQGMSESVPEWLSSVPTRRLAAGRAEL